MAERYDTIMVPHEDYLEFKKLMRDLKEFKQYQQALNALENAIDENIANRLIAVEDTLDQLIDIYNANVDKTSESDACLSKALKAQSQYNDSVGKEFDALEDYVRGINDQLDALSNYVNELAIAKKQGGESDADCPQTGR